MKKEIDRIMNNNIACRKADIYPSYILKKNREIDGREITRMELERHFTKFQKYISKLTIKFIKEDKPVGMKMSKDAKAELVKFYIGTVARRLGVRFIGEPQKLLPREERISYFIGGAIFGTLFTFVMTVVIFYFF